MNNLTKIIGLISVIAIVLSVTVISISLNSNQQPQTPNKVSFNLWCAYVQTGSQVTVNISRSNFFPDKTLYGFNLTVDYTYQGNVDFNCRIYAEKVITVPNLTLSPNQTQIITQIDIGTQFNYVYQIMATGYYYTA
jgi:hypothetical protein